MIENKFCEKELFAAERDAWRRCSISGRNIIMKNFIKGLAIMFVCFSAARAGIIKGTITYDGSTVGDITIAVFNEY